MSRTVILFGPPGCGKGTQAEFLLNALELPHISTGDMFRDHIGRETELGIRVKEILASGALVPDEVTDQMVEERLSREDMVGGELLDGYPRNVSQAATLERILSGLNRQADDVVVLEVDQEELLNRIAERGKTSGRADDQDRDKALHRLHVYREETEPCVGWYEQRGNTRVHRIDGVGTIEEVRARIVAALKLDS